jgi:aspartokinase-like uncharacterized kinase
MRPCVVYNLGGSLLDLPDLAVRLRALWQARADSDVLLVVGGGRAVEAVREWDGVFQLGEDAAHWLAIDALDLSASLLEHLVPELQLVRSLGQLRSAHAAGRPAVLCVKCFVKWLETQPEPLPRHWDVTSDSIAVAVTRAWQGQELVLLKSCDLPDGPEVLSLEDLVLAGLLDRYFPTAAANVRPISWVNFRLHEMIPRALG